MNIFGRKKRYSIRVGPARIIRTFECMEDAASWARGNGPGYSLWYVSSKGREHRLWTEGSENGLTLKETFSTAIGVIRRRQAAL